MKFTFYGTTVTMNEYINAERTNRFMASAIKKRETETLTLELRQQSAKPVEGKIDIEVTHHTTSKRIDPDNHLIFCKWFLDALQHAGVIENDGQKQVGRITQNAIRLDKENPRVEVVITPHTP